MIILRTIRVDKNILIIFNHTNSQKSSINRYLQDSGAYYIIRMTVSSVSCII